MNSDCIMHNYAKDKDGYGRITVHGKHSTIHRLVYSIHNKVSLTSIKGRVIRHTCDNSSCINPAHLILGTQADNIQDCLDRNRVNPPKGELHCRAKLTASQVLAIRARANEPQYKLAREFGVNRPAISKILLRTTWKHI